MQTYLGETGKPEEINIRPKFAYFLESDGSVFILDSWYTYQEGLGKYAQFLQEKNPPYVYCYPNQKTTVIVKQHENNLEVWLHEQYKHGQRLMFPVVFTDYFTDFSALTQFLDQRFGTDWQTDI
jgi:hypothetical protein